MRARVNEGSDMITYIIEQINKSLHSGPQQNFAKEGGGSHFTLGKFYIGWVHAVSARSIGIY